MKPSEAEVNFDRRQFMLGAATLGAGITVSRHGTFTTIDRALATAPAGSDLGAIEHVVFLMQENRSFDHYFGSYRGVQGFNDHPATSLGAFAQPYAANTTVAPLGTLLPFHLDSNSGFGECTHDISHSWDTQQRSRDNGLMDNFVAQHTLPQVDGPVNGRLTMGYYRRADLPYHYALADAFTLCDRYHCSILGPTHPNRLMSISGTIDPAGVNGGPVLTTENPAQALFSVNWTTAPELLEDAGVSWKTYTPPGEGFYPPNPAVGFGNAILPFFTQYQSPRSTLYQKAFLPTFPGDFAHDIRTGTLPKVSWIVSPNGFDEHPPSAPSYGAWFINRVLQTLMTNRKVWSKTVVFITYDENGGFFDHVAPPVAPPGTPGEYVSTSPLPAAAAGTAGPLGLGYRVPMLVVSPFSRGGFVSSDILDHTSQIRFLERRFGINASAISSWRRATVGDLTRTLRLGRANMSPPQLPLTTSYRARALSVQGCTPGDLNDTTSDQPAYPMADTQTMPGQEPGVPRRPFTTP